MSRQELALVGGVALGGAIGTVARYGLGSFIQARVGLGFPVGTLVINVVGAFLIGVLLELSVEGLAMNPMARLLLTTGFCGGFTTFSTFSYETVRLVQEGEAPRAAAYVALSLLLALPATLAGIGLARWVGGSRLG